MFGFINKIFNTMLHPKLHDYSYELGLREVGKEKELEEYLDFKDDFECGMLGLPPRLHRKDFDTSHRKDFMNH